MHPHWYIQYIYASVDFGSYIMHKILIKVHNYLVNILNFERFIIFYVGNVLYTCLLNYQYVEGSCVIFTNKMLKEYNLIPGVGNLHWNHVPGRGIWHFLTSKCQMPILCPPPSLRLNIERCISKLSIINKSTDWINVLTSSLMKKLGYRKTEFWYKTTQFRYGTTKRG